MNIEFDPSKDVANQEKHGVSLSFASKLEWDTALSWPDTRKDYGEDRRCALVIRGVRLYFVAYVPRGKRRRIISLRKANAREVKRYVEQS
jgi:uncharacterized DUF497 family protein